MTQKGVHTWDLVLHYHCCPHCKKIFESREDYQHQAGRNLKNVICPRCHDSFKVIKRTKKSFAPIFGDGEHVEVEWD